MRDASSFINVFLDAFSDINNLAPSFLYPGLVIDESAATKSFELCLRFRPCNMCEKALLVKVAISSCDFLSDFRERSQHATYDGGLGRGRLLLYFNTTSYSPRTLRSGSAARMVARQVYDTSSDEFKLGFVHGNLYLYGTYYDQVQRLQLPLSERHGLPASPTGIGTLSFDTQQDLLWIGTDSVSLF